MLRLVRNPPNPYLSAYAEYLDEPPPPARLEVYEETAASILSENDSPDIPFRFSINPYRGCQHACAYCYARPTHEYLGFGAGTDFETRICVKLNAAELLERALAAPRWSAEQIAFSGVTDCYQPLEAVYRLTRACLEVCVRYANPVAVVTKSYLVVRDLDVLRALQARAGVSVYLSIPFADDGLAGLIEPVAPRPSRRFDALRRLREAGIPAGVLVAPIIPGLNDREIPAILERAAACGATQAGYVPLRLPGSVAPVFLARLREALPERARRVEALIRQMRGGRLNDARFGARMRGQGAYWESVRELFHKSAARLALGRLDRCAQPPGPGVKRPYGRAAGAFCATRAPAAQLLLFAD